MNLKNFFTQQFMFQINSAFVSPAEKMVLFASGALILLGIVFKLSARLAKNPVDKNFRERFFNLFLTIGISELIWYGCRYQNAIFFGSHFLALVIALIGVVWLAVILTAVVKHYREDKTDWEKQQVKLKYLPK